MLFEKLWQNRQKWYWSVIGWICFIRRFWKQNHFGFFKLWRKNVFLLLSPLQSAYRPNHSTETALLRIVNDLPTATDNNKICILTLLDLSAAFDTIVHQKLSLPDFSTLLAFQKIQNAAARLVCKAKKYDHIHPILETLQWLPVTHRIQYKIPTASVPSLEQPLSICPISFNLILQQDNYDLHLTHEPLSPLV